MEFAEQLKSQVDIVRVVGEYVRLKRSGGGPRWVGLCPFHTEKTASFSVHSQHQFYKCFGCGAGGDVIKFIMEVERLTFWEAAKYLAERNGVPLPKRNDQAESEARKRGGLFEMHEVAAAMYRDLLFSPAGKDARSYLERRGLTRATAEQFGLGLSPRDGQTLTRTLEKRGYPHEEMEASGLVRARNEGGGHYDVFRGRLMFPIHSEGGKVIAFGARALAEGDEPKYLNSGDSEIYTKRNVLYNLNRARKSIQDVGFSVLVEGYMDVIGVFAAGVENVVATCGTALTNQQVRSLRRHAGDLVMNFDPDKAGANATEKYIPVLLEEGMHLKVLQLTEGLDPDEYIKENGAEAYKAALANARGYFHWLAERARQRFDLHTPEGRVAAFQFLLPAIQRMPDRLERLSVANDVADYMKIAPGMVLDEFRRAAAEKRSQVKAPPPEPLNPNEVRLLHALLTDAAARAQIAPALRRSSLLERFRARRIFEALLAMIEQGDQPTFSSVESRLEESDRTLLANFVFTDDTLAATFTTEQAVACLRRLEADEKRMQKDALRERMKQAEREGKLEEAFALAAELSRLERG